MSGDTYTTTAKYVWEGNSYYDPLLFALEGGSWLHPMYDGLGSTRQLLDNTTQNVTDEYAYEAFGNLMSSTGSTPNPYRYMGELGDHSSNADPIDAGIKWYMPSIGRFMTPSSPYAYAGNNPVTTGVTHGKLRPAPPDLPYPTPGYEGRWWPKIPREPPADTGTRRSKCARMTFWYYDRCIRNKFDMCTEMYVLERGSVRPPIDDSFPNYSDDWYQNLGGVVNNPGPHPDVELGGAFCKCMNEVKPIADRRWRNCWAVWDKLIRQCIELGKR